MKKIAIYFLVAFVLTQLCSCVTASRCAKKFPAKLIETTVTIHDTTIVTKGGKVDTLFKTKEKHDTINITRDLFHVRIIKSGDSLNVKGGCTPDTIKIPVLKTIYTKETRTLVVTPTWVKWFIGILVVIIGGSIYLKIKKFI